MSVQLQHMSVQLQHMSVQLQSTQKLLSSSSIALNNSRGFILVFHSQQTSLHKYVFYVSVLSMPQQHSSVILPFKSHSEKSSEKLHLRHILFSAPAICSERVADAEHRLNNYYATPCFQFIYMPLIYLRCNLIVFIIQEHRNTRPLLHWCQNNVTL
jgi:hypothetical protein